MCTGLHVTYQLLLSDFNKNWIFSTYFRKMLKYYNSWKSAQWGRVIPCGRTDRYVEANSRFSQFFERAQKVRYCLSL